MREWTDCHVHVVNGGVEELRALAESQKAYGYTASCFLSVEGMNDAAQNALAILFKLLDPSHYAFGGLHYRFAYDFAEELRELWDLGLDGMKMIENKPTERKRLGFAQDDERYDAMYALAEELGVPFLIHVADPREFWDPERIPGWAAEAGYGYTDGSFPSFGQLIGESVHMLEKHPKLRACFAHWFFLSDDEPSLRKLMERFPNLWLDNTAGTEMYYNFSAAPALWKRFFLDFQSRILYGTDNCNRTDDADRAVGDTLNALEKRFLTEDGRFPLWDGTIQGMGLTGAALEGIVSGNFKRFAGPEPRPLDLGAAERCLSRRLEDPRFGLTERERGIISRILEVIRQEKPYI